MSRDPWQDSAILSRVDAKSILAPPDRQQTCRAAEDKRPRELDVVPEWPPLAGEIWCVIDH